MNSSIMLRGNARALSALCLTATMLTPLSVYAQQKADSKKEISIDEIVVTATRRDLKLSDVPLSITALPQETLKTLGVRDSSDIAYIAPGLSVISGNSGSDNIAVRGVVALGSSATTAYYIDDTPIAQIGGSYFNPRYFDIERVEVLRGPQGTLFGSSAMGGAIRLITKRPNANRFEGAISAEGSTTKKGSESYIVDGVLNLPIVNDKLALRITGFYEKKAGWTRAFTPALSDNPLDYIAGFDPDTGAPIPGAVAFKGITGAGKRTGDQKIYGGRAALLFQPIDELKMTATYHWQKFQNVGSNTADESIGLGLKGSELRQARSVPGLRNVNTQLANFTGEFDFGFAKLTSSTSYEWARQTSVGDLTLAFLPLIVSQTFTVPRNAAGQAGGPALTDQKNTNFTQEVRLVSSDDGPFNWIVGGFYNRNKRLQDQNFTVFGSTAATGGFGGLIVNDSLGVSFLDESAREISVFGEVGYEFNDKLSATFGLRRYDVKITSAGTLSGLLAVLQGGSVLLPISAQDNGLTYKGVLKYKPNDDVMLFASYTTGYRPGGTNVPSRNPLETIPPGYGSDKLTQYELGWKTSWLDRKLSVNGALFYIDWKDIPTTIFSPITRTDYIINAPKARNYGVELELTMRPTEGLNVNFGVTVLSAQYSENYRFPNTATGAALVDIRKGERLPNVPDITLSSAINYEWSIGDDATARIGANTSLVSKRSQSINNDVASLEGFVNAGLSAGINFSKFDVSIFARNLFDTRALNSNFPRGNEAVAGGFSAINLKSYIQPRTIGANVQVKF
jgi:iron complex outermembrane recepter protein